jgi:anti-anti-sigma regulatory factor
MDMTVSIEKARVDVSLVHVDGNIDSSTYQEFEKRVQELIDEGARYVLIDLSHVPFLSSAGLRALNSLFYKLRSLAPDGSDEEMKQGIREGRYHSAHLKLASANRDVRQVLEISGFDMYLEILPDVTTALASF